MRFKRGGEDAGVTEWQGCISWAAESRWKMQVERSKGQAKRKLFELGEAVEKFLVLDCTGCEGCFEVVHYFWRGFAEKGFIG
jgi:hypothetical protein